MWIYILIIYTLCVYIEFFPKHRLYASKNNVKSAVPNLRTMRSVCMCSCVCACMCVGQLQVCIQCIIHQNQNTVIHTKKGMYVQDFGIQNRLKKWPSFTYIYIIWKALTLSWLLLILPHKFLKVHIFPHNHSDKIK